MSKIKLKKAQTEQLIIWLYRAPILILIILVFVGMIWFHFSKQYDVRSLEIGQITNKIVYCLTDNMVLEDSNFNELKLKSCFQDDQNLFLNLSFKNNFLAIGRKELDVLCQVQKENVQGSHMPFCLNKTYYVLNSERKLEKLNVYLALDKNEKNT